MEAHAKEDRDWGIMGWRRWLSSTGLDVGSNESVPEEGLMSAQNTHHILMFDRVFDLFHLVISALLSYI